jgi:hypothetical protein
MINILYQEDFEDQEVYDFCFCEEKQDVKKVFEIELAQRVDFEGGAE